MFEPLGSILDVVIAPDAVVFITAEAELSVRGWVQELSMECVRSQLSVINVQRGKTKGYRVLGASISFEEPMRGNPIPSLRLFFGNWCKHLGDG